jgi:hypothetical protein
MSHMAAPASLATPAVSGNRDEMDQGPEEEHQFGASGDDQNQHQHQHQQQPQQGADPSQMSKLQKAAMSMGEHGRGPYTLHVSSGGGLCFGSRQWLT